MRTRISTRTATTFFLVAMVTSLAEGGFVCNSTKSTCQALVDYKPVNDTNFSSIATLFQVESIYDIIGANSLVISPTERNKTIKGGTAVRVPVPCKCVNGTGTSDMIPVYKVKAGNTLDFIARELFSGIVTYQQIADASNIPDPNKIIVDQRVVIPLPCSCDPVTGLTVVHYAHLVAPGSTVAEIAADYGTTPEIIMLLNNMTNPKSLLADQVLDIPLQACNGSLLVANGTSVLAANDCVMCSCQSPQLKCEPFTSVSSSCPSMKCTGTELYIGNATSINNCPATCSYAGINDINNTIITTLVSDPTCNSGGISLKGKIWWRLFISLSIHLGLVCVGFLLGT